MTGEGRGDEVRHHTICGRLNTNKFGMDSWSINFVGVSLAGEERKAYFVRMYVKSSVRVVFFRKDLEKFVEPYRIIKLS